MMTSSTNEYLARRKQGLTIRALDGEVLVYDPETTRASCLNEFAAAVLERCDGERTPTEIARDLPFENVDQRLVLLALADLQKASLLEADRAIEVRDIIGPSRREFFKRLGVGAAIGVPVVTGLTLPAAAQSKSGEPCTNDTDCGPFLRCQSITQSGKNCDQPGADCRCLPI